MENPPKQGSVPSWNPSSAPRNMDSPSMSPGSAATPFHIARPPCRPEPAQTLQQRVIGFHDAEIGIVQQHQVLNGIERIRPLPVRAQDLLHQPQVLNRQSQLMGGGSQKFHLIRRV